MKAFLSFLLIILFAYTCCAQDVMNPADVVYTYNSSSAAGSNTNPNTPPAGVMAKWIRTVNRINWDASKFKCYYWNGMAFRLRFPNNYNPANATKYPVIVFLHGGGEVAPVTDNEDHLYWGAQLFEQRINAGEWNGFLLFPQETTVGWNTEHFSRINEILDTLQKYNRADIDRVIAMGLSSGGGGAVGYAQAFPQRVASCVPSSPAFISSMNHDLNNFIHIPMWVANGGIDNGPDPYETSSFMNSFRGAGGNFYQTYLADEGHITWSLQWNLKDGANKNVLTSWWNTAHKAQPLVYYNNDKFCTGSVNARLGITAGYAAYEWQQEVGGSFSTIADATGNELQVTTAGRYRVRFKRDAAGAWSDWTPNPVVIAEKTCSTDTLFAEHFNSSDIFYYSETPYKPYSFGCQNGVITSSTYNISQDGTGKTGNYFLLHNTAANGCNYTTNDEVWHNASLINVAPNTTYEYVFYLANRSTSNNAKIVPKINGGLLPGGFVQATGSGNASWTKYKFLWNSGNNTVADIALVNQVSATSGNDFAIDEISFGAPAANQPPVANAGNAITITLPTSSTTLNGGASTDADGTIASYAWTKIDGPAQFTIANAAAASTSVSNLVQGVYTFQLTVTDNGGASASATVTVTVNPGTVPVCGTLPAGIGTTDVGGGGLLGLGGIATGSVCFTNPSTYTVKGAGDLTSSSDKFRFVYKSFSGNGTTVVRLTSLDAVSTLNKAGLMFRETLNSGAAYAFMGLTSGDGAYLQSQVPGLLGLFTTVSTTKYGNATLDAPIYLRLTRNGSTFTGAVSADSITWITVGSKTVSMASSVYVGLAVCSHSTNTLSQAIFDNWHVYNGTGQQVLSTGGVTTTAAATIEAGVTIAAAPLAIVASELKVYPNPTIAGFIVDFSVVKKQNVWVTITSGADGRVCYTESIANFSGTYHKDMGNLKLAKGTYAVTIGTAAGVKTIILVKQ